MNEQLYKAIHAYQAQQDDELALKPNDTIRVLKMENDDWWLAELTESGQRGLVPSNFLEKFNETLAAETPSGGRVLAKVIKDYTPTSSDELALWKNGIVTVLDQSVADGWWKGDLNGKTGTFPADHVKVIEGSEDIHGTDKDHEERRKSGFKLAAYGVKQGGIGSILAGGFSLKRRSTKHVANAEEPHSPEEQSSPIAESPQSAQPQETTETADDSDSVRAMVIHDYEPENDDELRLMRGEYVTIVNKMDDKGWWKGVNERGMSGLFPSSYVQVLEEQRPPPRPNRARPPTIKTDTTPDKAESPVSPTSMARPPPVPVSTRPSMLLSNRSSAASDHGSGNNPPPRPVTLPPTPARRSTSMAEPKTHKPRAPSIPLVAADLPPMAGRKEENTSDHSTPVRPVRPIPTPGQPRDATDRQREKSIPEGAEPTRSSFAMAKPPKVPSGPLPTPRTSRPPSQTMGPSSPVASTPRSPSQTDVSYQHQRQSSEERISHPPNVPKRSVPLPPRTISATSTTQANDEDNHGSPSRTAPSLPASPPPRSVPASPSEPGATKTVPVHTSSDSLEAKIQAMLKKEMESFVSHFESLLEEERRKRQELEEQVRLLQSQLN